MTREEIADLVEVESCSTRLADAVRSLPVIATCGECGWRHRVAVRGGTVHECEHPRLTIDEARVRPDNAPESWCPLRGKR